MSNPLTKEIKECSQISLTMLLGSTYSLDFINFIFTLGQMNTVNKLIKGDRIPTLRNLVLFPILVSLDKDESLEVSVFSFPTAFIAFVLLTLPSYWFSYNFL